MFKFSNYKTSKKEKFLKYSYLRNGFLKNFIRKHYERKNEKTPGFEINELIVPLFMCLLLVRTFISITISDGDYTLLMYIGRPWHLVGAYYAHNEILFLLWTLNFICVYVFVIKSPTKHYKWIETFAFLNGILPHQQIGNYLLFS
jgi:hypothetical protein